MMESILYSYQPFRNLRLRQLFLSKKFAVLHLLRIKIAQSLKKKGTQELLT